LNLIFQHLLNIHFFHYKYNIREAENYVLGEAKIPSAGKNGILSENAQFFV